MHPNTIKPYINMMLFSIRHDLTGTAFVECTEGLFDLIAQALEPFGCTISPFKSKVIGNTIHRWTTDVIGPFMQGSTSVTLTVEIVPWDKRWQVHASFNPGNNGQSDIFDTIKGNDIYGDGAIYRLVHNIAHRANAKLVQDRLSLEQKVTFSTDYLYQALPGNQGSIRYTEDGLVLKLYGNPLEQMCILFTGDTCLKLAGNLDELTVANVSDHGYVTLRNPAGDQFMLNADEAIAAIPELQV